MNKEPSKECLTIGHEIPNTNGDKNCPLVLVVEKEEDYAILLQRIFIKIARHWRVARVSTVKEAIGYFVNEEFPDLLVTNMETSNLKARDIIEWLLYMKTPKQVSVLIFDHAPSAGQARELGELGVKEYLNKRVPTEKYRSILRRLTLEIDTQSKASTTLDSATTSEPGFGRRF